MYQEILTKLTNHTELSDAEIFNLISAISRDEISDVQIGGFQVALLMKSPTLGETSAIARAMRENCVRLNPRVAEPLMDTCGTGGGLSTFLSLIHI